MNGGHCVLHTRVVFAELAPTINQPDQSWVVDGTLLLGDQTVNLSILVMCDRCVLPTGIGSINRPPPSPARVKVGRSMARPYSAVETSIDRFRQRGDRCVLPTGGPGARNRTPHHRPAGSTSGGRRRAFSGWPKRRSADSDNRAVDTFLLPVGRPRNRTPSIGRPDQSRVADGAFFLGGRNIDRLIRKTGRPKRFTYWGPVVPEIAPRHRPPRSKSGDRWRALTWWAKRRSATPLSESVD